MAHRPGYDVLLDAAAFVPTNTLSLRDYGPDFVCVSFYKMLGFPTGVGALLARREALCKLRRPWFGGGTVRFASAQPGVHLLHATGRGFEDGTPNYLDIAAIPPALDFLRDIGMRRIHEHVGRLTELLLRELSALRHTNGAALVRLYGPRTTELRGGTVAFNVLTADGAVADCRAVEERAAEANISLRAGYFCNPGAAESAFGHDRADVQRCFSALSDGFSLPHFSICMEDRPVGAVRVSLGLASNRADLHRLLEVLAGFGNGHLRQEPLVGPERAGHGPGAIRRSTGRVKR
jgi:selenocysteine lyase/cysteine desulfurase